MEVVMYGGYKGEQEIDNFYVAYEELELSLLQEIHNLLHDAIESNLI